MRDKVLTALVIFALCPVIPLLGWGLISFATWEVLPLSKLYTVLRGGVYMGVVMVIWYYLYNKFCGEYK